MNKVKILIISVIIFCTGFLVYKFSTDDSFLASIRYRFYGLAYIDPYTLHISNENDTLYLARWWEPIPEYIKVSWSGDTTWLPIIYLPPHINRFAYPDSFFQYFGFDSTVIQVRHIHSEYYRVVPVSVGISKLIGIFQSRWRDTLYLEVRRDGNRLLIEGEKVYAVMCDSLKRSYIPEGQSE